jgi:polar amino acid transport system substrate-binding protein/glutamate/aspartate transport system substrate-binding protein
MQRRFRALLVRLCCLAGLALVASACHGDGSRIFQRLNKQPTLKLGYRADAAPFSFKDRDGSVRGYSVELCNRVAAAIQNELGLVRLKVEWTPLDAADRIDAVAKRRIDMECGTTTIALSRYEKVDFSVPIFVDGGSVLTASSSKYSRLADLAGARIAIIPGTTTEVALRRALDVLQVKAELIAVKNGPEGLAQVVDGKVDGFASDRIVLVTLRDTSVDPSKLSLLDNDFSFEPYALVVPRDDPDFRLMVNRTLVGLYRSGDIDAIFYRWLGALGRPGPLLNSMFYLNTLPE